MSTGPVLAMGASAMTGLAACIDVVAVALKYGTGPLDGLLFLGAIAVLIVSYVALGTIGRLVTGTWDKYFDETINCREASYALSPD